MFKRIVIGTCVVTAGMMTLFGVYTAIEKHREKVMGGRLMKVQYRFTQEFND